MRNLFRTSLLAVLVPAVLLLAAGCSDDDDTTTTGADMGQGSELRIVHASPDAPAVDIYAEGVTTPLATNVAYGDATPYLELAAGEYNIQLRGAGSAAGSAPAFETGMLTIPDGAKITAAAVGLFNSNAADDKFRVLTFAEGFDAAGAGNAIVRIIHASADAPTVALDVGNNGNADVPNFERFGDTGAAGVPLPANTELQIAVWAGEPLSRVTVFTTPQLPEGAELFVFATGLLGKLPREDDGFSLLAVAPTGAIGFVKQNPVVFALHASPDAPAVDIYAGDAELVDNLSFGNISAPIQVAPGSYTLSFRSFDNGPEAASATTPALAAGERYLAVASGYLLSGTPAFTLLPYADGFDLSSDAPLVRVLHASPDAPPVDVGTVSGGTVTAVEAFTNLSFTEVSTVAGPELPVGTLPIGIAGAGTTEAVASFSVPTATGVRAFAIAAGSFGAESPGERFRLLIVDTASYPWASAELLPVE